MSEIVVQSVLPLTALLAAFLLSGAVALVYASLHRDVPNMRVFAQTLAMAGIVSAMIVLSIGDSIARGIGLVGALTVIRFRSDLASARSDLCLRGTGDRCGGRFERVGRGRRRHDGLSRGHRACVASLVREIGDIRCHPLIKDHGISRAETIGMALRVHCHSFDSIRVRQSTDATQEHAYQVRLKEPGGKVALVQAMNAMAGIDDALLVTLDGPDSMVVGR